MMKIAAAVCALAAAGGFWLGGSQHPGAQPTPAKASLSAGHDPLGLSSGERAQGAESRKLHHAELVKRHDQEARQELLDGYRALRLVGTARRDGRLVFLPPAAIAHRLGRYSYAHFDRLSQLGYFLAPKRPRPGFYGGGDMNALLIDRDSTPDHVVLYQGTEDYKVYELDAYLDRAPVVFDPYAKGPAHLGFAVKPALAWGLVSLLVAIAGLYLLSRLGRVLVRGGRRTLEPLRARRAARASLQSWRAKVEPGQGPHEPSEGYRLLEARWAREKDGQDVRISFQADELEFHDGEWRVLNVSAPQPAEGRQRFLASEPMEEIVAAWVEFAAAIAAENARRYQATLDADLRAEAEQERRLEEARQLEERWQLPELLPEAREAVRGLSLS